jgi:hypothetical protein
VTEFYIQKSSKAIYEVKLLDAVYTHLRRNDEYVVSNWTAIMTETLNKHYIKITPAFKVLYG